MVYRDRDRHSDFSDVSENDFERRQRRFAMELEAVNAKRVVQVQYPRTGKNDKELTVQQGEILEVGCRDRRKQYALHTGCYLQVVLDWPRF